MIRPKGRVRIFFFRLINSKTFESVIMGFIVLNIASMGFVYETMSDGYKQILDYINIGFTVVFVIEFILKIVALDFQYFTSSWNNFDFTIVILSRLPFIHRLARPRDGSILLDDQLPQTSSTVREDAESPESISSVQAHESQAT
jgi:hypothetical protein